MSVVLAHMVNVICCTAGAGGKRGVIQIQIQIQNREDKHNAHVVFSLVDSLCLDFFPQLLL